MSVCAIAVLLWFLFTISFRRIKSLLFRKDKFELLKEREILNIVIFLRHVQVVFDAVIPAYLTLYYNVNSSLILCTEYNAPSSWILKTTTTLYIPQSQPHNA